MKMKRRTIEQLAKANWGITSVPQFATYLLADGTMLNGSYEGHQRDIDHREINEFMPSIKNTKYEYSSLPYVYRFMKRGNIRMNCNKNTIQFEFWKIPTREQWHTIKSIFSDYDYDNYQFYIEKYYPNKNNKVFFTKRDFIEWLDEKVNFCLY